MCGGNQTLRLDAGSSAVCGVIDHKPLTFAIHKVSEPWTARQARHLSYIAEFCTDIRHVASVDNSVPIMLSWPPGQTLVCTVPASESQLGLADLAASQRTCPSVDAANQYSLQLQLIPPAAYECSAIPASSVQRELYAPNSFQGYYF